jgi:hypothetical protein
MPGLLAPALEALLADPVVLYSTGAAALLLVVSLGSGIGRRDYLALTRPRTLLRVLGAVTAAFLLQVADALWGADLPAALAAVAPGLHRLPLYLVALAYGPATGVFVGVLFAGFHAGDALPGWPEAVLTLELAVLGWLAIYPSPRDTRVAGPLDALLAYALAWGTAGVALLAARHGSVTLDLVWTEHAAVLPGVVASALLLVLFGPGAYRRAFPGSRIYPPVPPRRQPGDAPAPALAVRTALAADGVEHLLLDQRERRRGVTLGVLAHEPSLPPESLPARRSRGERALPPFPEADLAFPQPVRRRRLERRRLPEELSRS